MSSKLIYLEKLLAFTQMQRGNKLLSIPKSPLLYKHFSKHTRNMMIVLCNKSKWFVGFSDPDLRVLTKMTFISVRSNLMLLQFDQ